MPLAVAVNPGKVNKGELILQGWRAGGGAESGWALQNRLQTDKTRWPAVINWPLLTGINLQPLIKAK